MKSVLFEIFDMLKICQSITSR